MRRATQVGTASAATHGRRREVREESGAEIRVDRLTGIYKNMTAGVVALVFRAHLTGGILTPTDEAAAVEWWTTEQVTTGQTEAFAVRILDALADRTEIAIRHHDGVNVLP